MLSLLRMRLHQVVACQSAETEAADCLPAAQRTRSHLDQTIQALPIKRLNKAIPFVYVCAIAHRLATQSQSADSIAAHLVELLGQTLHRDALTSDVVMQATATGLIQFEVGDRAIATWLDALLHKTLPPQPFVSAETEPSIVLTSAAIFEVQYAHARCCSLLRLAHSEALIQLDGLNEAPLLWRVGSPTSVPWLTATQQLYLDHPLDRHLLGHLIEARDCLSDRSPRRTQSTLRSAHAIAQAMQLFHRVHPLWRKRTEPNLVVSQLGLLMATQYILHLLLSEGLHLQPVVEL